MALTVLLGGARSGKSTIAERLAARSGRPVTFVATAEAGDAEMAARIAAHRADRPATWETVEDPQLRPGRLASIDSHRFLIIDCLTLWLANLLAEADDELLDRATTVARLLADRPGGAVVVSNEVGGGIVPADPVTRRYRDLLGRINTAFVAVADPALLVVAGRVLKLQELELAQPELPAPEPRAR